MVKYSCKVYIMILDVVILNIKPEKLKSAKSK